MKVLVAAKEFSEDSIKYLKSKVEHVVVNHTGERLSWQAIVSERPHGIIAGGETYSPYMIQQMTNLKAISRVGVGLDNIDLDEARVHGVKVFKTSNVHVAPVAELAIGLLISLLRRIPEHDANMRRFENHNRIIGRNVCGMNIGIIGHGAVGKHLDAVLTTMGAKVWISDKRDVNHNAMTNNICAECDAIILCASGRDCILNHNRIDMLKDGAVVVNVARGQLVDEAYLSESLWFGKLGGYASDVFIEEPYKGDMLKSRLTVFTPHIGSCTKECRSAMEKEAIDNLLVYLGVTV